jgi:hypothetical protein
MSMTGGIGEDFGSLSSGGGGGVASVTPAANDPVIEIGGTASNPTVGVRWVDTAFGTPRSASLTGIVNPDGITGFDGMVTLLAAQANPIQNGPWVMHTGAWTRPTWWASGSSQFNAFFFCEQGNTWRDTMWSLTNAPADIAVPVPVVVDTNNAVIGGPGIPPCQFGFGFPTSGAGLKTPAFIGQLYIDLNNGGLWSAYAVTSGSWIGVGGVTFNANRTLGTGFDSIGGGKPAFSIMGQATGSALLPPNGGGVVIYDNVGSQGSANGIFWADLIDGGTWTDGNQTFVVQVGPPGTPLQMVLTPAGQLNIPVGFSSKPANSSAFTITAGATGNQNMNTYDVLVSGFISVSSATAGATITLGTGSATSPTKQTLVTLPTIAAATLFAYSAYVPSLYWLGIDHTGTAVLGTITGVATPV